MRTTKSDNGTTITADTAEQGATTHIVLTFDDNRLASQLFGQYGQNLALIERRLGAAADQRGNQVTLEGARDTVEQARRVLQGLYDRLRRGDEVTTGDVEGAIRLAISPPACPPMPSATIIRYPVSSNRVGTSPGGMLVRSVAMWRPPRATKK